MIFLMILLSVYKVKATCNDGRKQICNRGSFKEQFEKNATNILNANLVRENCKTCNKSKSCNQLLNSIKKPWDITYGLKQDKKQAIVIRLSEEMPSSKKISSACWGIAIQVEVRNEYQTEYYMNETQINNLNKPGLVIDHYKGGEYYGFAIIFLPSGKRFSTENIRVPKNKCEDSAHDGLKKAVEESKKLQKCYPDVSKPLFKVANEVCAGKKDDAMVEQKILDNILEERCLQSSSATFLQKNEPKLSTLTVAFLVFTFVLLTLIVAFLIYKKRSFFKICQKEISTRGHEMGATRNLVAQEIEDVPLTIMILNRPGCDLLDILMVNLGCVLKAHGFEIKMALLEQTQIDAEGGIASYMQRNIDIADYILIACTEEKSIDKNSGNPYEFALRVIGGLAYHNNNSSRYIPIYLQDYSQAIELIPTFLSANTNTGFKIPENIPSLVEYLAPTTGNDENKQLKMKYFVKEMQKVTEKYIAEEHTSCCQGSCSKGKIIPRCTSTLSSGWTSTVQNSQWSFQSIQDVNLSVCNMA